MIGTKNQQKSLNQGRGSLEAQHRQARVEEVLLTAKGLSDETRHPEIMTRARSKGITPMMWVLWARKTEVIEWIRICLEGLGR